LRLTLPFDATLQLPADRAGGLTGYAWKFRYPGEAEEPRLPEAEAALALDRKVYEEILACLPAQARP